MPQSQLLIISDGLISSEKGYITHPLLDPWRKQLLRCSRSWFECDSKTALEWYASLLKVAPVDVLATAVKEHMPVDACQVWIASPYHAQLVRDHIRVMPDSLLPWSEEDARWICELLNPLLREEGIELLHHKAALLLVCRDSMDATPDSFASVAGKVLPNRHPDGADGGRLMRLMAEIQMVLNLKPAQHRRASGEPDIHGLWMSGGRDLSDGSSEVKSLPVATRNPLLMSLVDGKDATVIITDAEQLAELAQSNLSLPKQVVLAGDGKVVVLKPSLIPRFGKASWQPKSVGEEDRFMNMLRGMI
jgi:hypothetical protein